MHKGPVSPDISSKVNESVRVLNLTGTTEGLFIGNLVVPREDWFWFAFHPRSGFEFREIEPGVFEHWIHRNEHWSLFQGIFHTFPEKDSINTKDLYFKHATKAYLWSFKGRSDDVVVLSNGYKLPPLATEAYITTHPDILGCVMVSNHSHWCFFATVKHVTDHETCSTDRERKAAAWSANRAERSKSRKGQRLVGQHMEDR